MSNPSSENTDRPEKAKFTSSFSYLKAAFKEPLKSVDFLVEHWSDNPFVEELERYQQPSKFIVELLLYSVCFVFAIFLYIGQAFLEFASIFIQVGNSITRSVFNWVTGNQYELLVNEQRALSFSEYRRSYLKTKKTELLDMLRKKPFSTGLDEANKIEAMCEDEFFKYQINSVAEITEKKKRGLDLVTAQFLIEKQIMNCIPVSGIDRIRFAFKAAYRALIQAPKSNWFVSVFIGKPLQALALLVLLPLVTTGELVKAAKTTVYYAGLTVTLCLYYSLLFILAIPLKIYDLVKAIYNNCCVMEEKEFVRNTHSIDNSLKRDKDSVFENELNREEVPGHHVPLFSVPKNNYQEEMVIEQLKTDFHL
jgi:predicted CopG family antitoxin